MYVLPTGTPEATGAEMKARDFELTFNCTSSTTLTLTTRVTNRPQLPVTTYNMTLGEELEQMSVDGVVQLVRGKFR